MSEIDRLEKMLNSEPTRPVTILVDGTVAEGLPETAAPVPSDHPLRQAWDAYRATWGYENSKAWALHIAPMAQAGSDAYERQRRFEIMPLDQRERHVEGSLWAAFMAGYQAAHDRPRATGPIDAEDL